SWRPAAGGAVKAPAKPCQRMIPVVLKGNMAGDGQLDLCSGGGAAPDMKSGAYSVRPLPHAGKPPVSIEPRPQNLGIDATTIVPHQNPQMAGGILELEINPLRAGMPERIDQRFAADSIHLIAQQWA